MTCVEKIIFERELNMSTATTRNAKLTRKAEGEKVLP